MSNYWNRALQRQRLSRRRFVGSAGASAAGLAGFALVGCGDDDDDDGNEGSPGASPTASGSSTAGSGGAAQDGGFYRIHYGTGLLDTQDIHRSILVTVITPLGMAHDNLILYDDPDLGTLRADVTTSLPEQVSETEYIFSLRDDVTWQDKPPADGRPLTAEDVVWNMERQRDRTTFAGEESRDFARYTSTYQFVETVEATDERTVRVTLNRPYAPWLISMADDLNGLMLREVAEMIEPNLNEWNPDLIIGTGAYFVDEFVPTDRIRLRRNPDYFRKRAGDSVAHFDELSLVDLGTDVNAVRAAFEQKQIDRFFSSTDPDLVDAVASATPGTLAYDVPDPNLNATIGYSVERGPLADPRVRRAFFLALDRERVLQTYYKGAGRLNGPVPWPYLDWALSQEELAETPGYRANKEEDIAEARALWEEAGGDAIGNVIIRASQSPTNVDWAEWFPAMMNEALGTNQVQAELIPTQNLLGYLTGDNFEALWVSFTRWSSPDPRARLADDFLLGGGLNFGNYQNDEVTAMFDRAFAEFDVPAAQEIMHEIQRFTFEDGGAGKFLMAGGVNKTLRWPYVNRRNESFIGYEGKILAQGATANGQYVPSFIDPSDESIDGRPSL